MLKCGSGMFFLSLLLLLLVAPSKADETEAPTRSPPEADDELIIYYYGSAPGCFNPLDEARILVAVADFLESFYAGGGAIPDPQSLNRNNTCIAQYNVCNIDLGGGCCSGSVCKVTTNGLQRCVDPDYEPTRTGQGGSCARGQPCETALECIDETCQQPAERRLRALAAPVASTQEQQEAIIEPMVVDTGFEFQDEEQRKLYDAAWCQRGRKCGKCSLNNYIREWKKGDAAQLDMFCNSLCMFECGRRRRLQTVQMDNFIAALETYMFLLDFGDDCDTGTLTFDWYVGKPSGNN